MRYKSMSQRIRVNRDSVAWWLRHFRFTIDWWEVGTSHGLPCLIIGYYDVREPQSSHQFYF